MELPVMYDTLSAKKKREVRDEYVKIQNSRCLFCDKRLDLPAPKEVTCKKINWKLFPPNFLKYPVHLQHSHQTGLTEGAVHAYCNAVLWQYYGR